MQFATPAFLFALSVLIIPIIIHLFHFRTYKTVYYSNIAFLKNIQTQTASKSRLRQLLVLLARLLALSCLVLAFAQPYIPSKKNSQAKKDHLTGIYIDNSFSADAESQFGKLIETAKKKALITVDAFPSGTDFIFLSNEFNPLHFRWVAKEQIKEFVIACQTEPESRNLSEIIQRFKSLSSEMSKAKNDILYIVSDFQKYTSDFKKLPNDSTLKVILVPLETMRQSNISIDSLWFDSPERKLYATEELYVSVTNRTSDDLTDIPLKLFLNDTLKVPGAISIPANSNKTEKLSFSNNKAGIIEGRVEITDFPITFDNSFYFNYTISEQRNLLIIGNELQNKYIDKLFSDNNYFKVEHRTPGTIQNSEISKYDVIITDELKEFPDDLTRDLAAFVASGGTLFVLPATNSVLKSYNTLFEQIEAPILTAKDSSKLFYSKINYNDPLFKDVFLKTEENPNLPVVMNHFKFGNINAKNQSVLLSAENYDPMLVKAESGSGKSFILAQSVDPRYGNLVFHPIWTPILYNIAVSGNRIEKLHYTIGEDNKIHISAANFNDKNTVQVQNIKTKTNFIPLVRKNENGTGFDIFPESNIRYAGNYTIIYNDKPTTGAAFNYNRNESQTEFYTTDEIKKIIKDQNLSSYSVGTIDENTSAANILPYGKQIELWKYFIVAALFFLLAEILIIKLLK
jgi:hypothetical protein